MNDLHLKKLCDELRDAEDAASIRKAAARLRLYLKEEQFIVRAKLQPYVEKLFLALDIDRERLN